VKKEPIVPGIKIKIDEKKHYRIKSFAVHLTVNGQQSYHFATLTSREQAEKLIAAASKFHLVRYVVDSVEFRINNGDTMVTGLVLKHLLKERHKIEILEEITFP